ncbi:hypothetical protein [Chondromyces crocatus]|uniref:Secreted protein n=1 Tax=Chondromyces crocatus TaxID=52 RepID=A0A0K1EAF1_CHOCO|nr:hypothetical protein [Chondromyces crocatus]AKT37850.1 uncharacterized protein CMC5_019930 [Chondromyces crocatus]
MVQLPGRILRGALLLLALSSTACNRSTPAGDDMDTARNWALQVSVRAEVVAELIFEENKLARVEYKSQDPALRDGFQTRLDSVMEEARREGLAIKFHLPDGNGEHGGLYGAQPRPGEPFFTQAMREHLGDGTFSIRVK